MSATQGYIYMTPDRLRDLMLALGDKQRHIESNSLIRQWMACTSQPDLSAFIERLCGWQIAGGFEGHVADLCFHAMRAACLNQMQDAAAPSPALWQQLTERVAALEAKK